MPSGPVLRSIGQVLTSLRGEFPEVSISKIRFLESEGLIAPQRAPSGYRRYTDQDVVRLRYVLSVQAQHYLPLRVIREHLEMMDRGMRPPRIESLRPVADPDPGLEADSDGGRAGAGANAPAAGPAGSGATGSGAGDGARPESGASPAIRPTGPLRLSRAELLQASGLPEPALAELERMQIVTPRRGTQAYGRNALVVARAAKRLAEFGIDSRHLRAVKLAADREAGLLDQAIAPHVRRAAGTRDIPGEVSQHVADVHAALLRSAMDR